MMSIQTLQRHSFPQLGHLPDQPGAHDRQADEIANRNLKCSSDPNSEIPEQILLSAFMHSSPDLMGIVSFDGQWMSLNPTGQNLLQWNPALDRSRTIQETLCATEVERWSQTILPTVMQQGDWQGTLRFRHDLGHSILLLSQWFLVRDRYTNEPLGLATISRRVPEPTETINEPEIGLTLAELSQTLAHEKALNQQKSQFLTEISHDLRAPLSVIASSAGILQSMGDRLEATRKQKHFEKIQLKVKQMTQLLEDLLWLGKTEQTQDLAQDSETDLVSLCAELVEEAQMSTTQHEILFSASTQLFQPLRHCVNAVDPNLLQRIIVNLLSNSIKYSPNGGKIYFDLIEHPETIVFQVKDSGIGIPLEEQQQLCNAFYRASNIGTIPGTGLGLAIVKRCIDLQGGSISIYSDVGVGTTFVVEIPKQNRKWGKQRNS